MIDLVIAAPSTWHPFSKKADAQMYALMLNSNGVVGWRLPTNLELKSLYNYNRLPLKPRHYWASDDSSAELGVNLQTVAVRASTHYECTPISEHIVSYDEAVLYSFLCTHNGFRDWSIPTPEEYLGLGIHCDAWHTGNAGSVHPRAIQLVRTITS